MSGRAVRKWRNMDVLTKNLLLSHSALCRLPKRYTLPLEWIDAGETWEHRGVTCLIRRSNILGKELEAMQGVPELEFSFNLFFKLQHNYNGYAIFPKRPLREVGYRGIASYVPVHGGITFARPLEDGRFVYGFDTAHLNDEQNSLYSDVDWAKDEVQRMVFAIQTARSFERRYRLAKTTNRKARVLDEYRNILRHHHIIRAAEDGITGNMGVMLNLLSGRL